MDVPRISAWQMWGEPYNFERWLKLTSAYRDSILKVGYNAAKKADPTCLVVTAALEAGFGLDSLSVCLQNGGIDHLDVVGIDPYYNTNPPKPFMINFIADAESRIKNSANPNDLPELWITETGSYTVSCPDTSCSCEWAPNPVNLDTQAIYIVEICEIIDSLYMEPHSITEKVFFYELKDYPYCIEDKWVPRFGIVDKNLNPKPAYSAYRDYIFDGKVNRES